MNELDELLLELTMPPLLRDAIGTAKGNQAWQAIGPVIQDALGGQPVPAPPALSAGQEIEDSLALTAIQKLLGKLLGAVKGNAIFSYALPVISNLLADVNPLPSLTNTLNAAQGENAVAVPPTQQQE